MSVEFWVQFIIAIITVLASVISVVSLPGKPLKLICGSVFVVLGVVWVLLLRSQIATAEKSASELKDTLAKLSASQEQLETAQSVNNRLQQQLIVASTAITRLSNETLKTTTGGDSFAVASVVEPLNPSDKPVLVLVHAGKYPLYGLSIRLFDGKLAAAAMKSRGAQEPVPDTGIQWNVGNLDLGGVTSAPVSSLDGDASRRFTLFFHARNGDWIEVLVMHRVRERWVQAMKVYKSTYRKGDSKPHEHDMYTRVDPGYPREDDKVNWNIVYEAEGCKLSTGAKCP